MYLISACLLGKNCKYNGGNNFNSEVAEFAKGHSVMAVCPETAGGLTAPRPPAEIRGEQVFNKEGHEVTAAFISGAEKTFKAALEEAEKRGEEIEGAILKAKSPSCGTGVIYDGSFSGNVTEGNGIFTRLLAENGIETASEEDFTDNKIFTNRYKERK